MPKGQPNILVIWGDDIGITNLSCYSDGLMGYRTPNIDRIADEGMRFTDAYGEQSCTAGRAAFITGQSVFRTGPQQGRAAGVATSGCSPRIPTIAELLKEQGYATAQFGKNHLGDKNEFLPTVHGFDEFFGNLYHLNAEEDPEDPDYPSKHGFEGFHDRFGPRGVLRCRATTKDDPKEHPRWGRVGKQRIEDTGPLTRKRMETCDDEFAKAACDYIERQHNRRKPFFCWVNFTHMHLRTHTKKRSLGQAGRWQSPYHDTMLDHDKNVGQILDLLDRLGLAEDTIVMYGTDNGPHMNTWPDGAMTPFRSEKNTNWEGAFRVPLIVRWPGKIAAGAVSNEIVQHHDWLPTFLAAAGEPDVVEKLKQGHEAARQDVQGAHRRLQPAPVPDRRGGAEPAPGLHLLLGRRRPRRPALRQLEARLHGATGARDARAVGRAVRPAPGAEALQPAHRPVRAGRRDVEHLLGLVHVEGVHDHGRARRSSGSSWRRSRSSRPARRRRASRSTRRSRRCRTQRRGRAADARPRFVARHPDPRGARQLRRGGRRSPCRRRSASPSSTTTARSGARSRCRSSSASSCSGSPRWRRRTSRCASSSRGRPPTRRTTPGSAA